MGRYLMFLPLSLIIGIFILILKLTIQHYNLQQRQPHKIGTAERKFAMFECFYVICIFVINCKLNVRLKLQNVFKF